MKTVKIFFCMFILLIIKINESQSQTLFPNYSINFPAGNEDEVQKSIIDTRGNIYVAGILKSDKLIFGNDTLIRKGERDIFLVKIDTQEKVLFAKSFFNNGYSKVTGLVVDNDENIYITGFYQNLMKFDAVILNNLSGQDGFGLGLNNSFVAKIKSNGETIWAKPFGGNSNSNSIIIDGSNNVYISGYFNGKMTISSIPATLNSTYHDNQFLIKINSIGSENWVKQYGGSLLIDKHQNIYMVGSYMDSIHLGNKVLKTISNQENHNVYVAKADTSGNIFWAKKYCEGEHALFEGGILDTVSNTIVLCGTFKTKTLTFDNFVIQNNGAADIFYAKIDTSGQVLMAKSFGGNGSDYSWGLSRINTQYIAIIGTSHSDSIVFGNYVIRGDISNYSFGDFFIAVVDNDGNPIWSKSFPKSTGQALKSILSDGTQNVFIVGDFYSADIKILKSSAFSDEPTFIEKTSLYLLKFMQGPVFINSIYSSSNLIDIYPNPATNIININIDPKSTSITSEIFNIEGRSMLKKSLVNESSINIEILPAGVYLIKVVSGDKIFVKKFIKKAA
jgi:hypothetical protein